jgi:predicted TIM-barrel fold metal-dependent hydrolase
MPALNTPGRIVDAHHHLWDLDACHYPWLMQRGTSRFFGNADPIRKNYLVSDFRADIGRLPVTASVHVQVGAREDHSVAETLWLERVAEREGLPSAIVAFCDLSRPDLEQELDRHAAATRLRGIRQILGRSAEEDAITGTSRLLDDPAFARGLETLARRGLSFDLQLTPPLMKRAHDMFARIPGLRVALCHAGSPGDFGSEGIRQWRDGLAQLARLPNVICKLSGFGMFEHEWTVASLRSRILTAIDLFGPARIAFGSNFPVDRLYRGYAEVMSAYFEITRGFSPVEREAMFSRTAEEFYRLERPVSTESAAR